MALIQFTRNHTDHSTDKGYQFEFFCDRCGNRFMSEFKASATGFATSALRAAGDVFGGIFGQASAGSYEVERMVRGPGHDKAFRDAVGETKPNFRQCPKCSHWVCRRARQINIVVDTARLAALDLTVAEVVGALASQNVQGPGGCVEQGSRALTLRTYGRVARPEEFALIPVAQRGGITIRVGDLARVEDGMEEETSWAALDGERAVTLEVRKQSGSNTIEYKIGEIFGEIKNKVHSGYNLREIIDHIDELRFRSRTEKHELSHLYEAKIKNMGNAGRNGGE